MDVDIAGQFMGPRLRALPLERQRRFAVLMAAGELSASRAAEEAGYPNGGAGGAVRVRAHELMHNPDVLAAIEECTRYGLQSLAPLAIRQAKAILKDRKHKSHARMIETVLDRTGFFAKTEHKVTVEHTVDVKELEALAARLARENGIAPERFIGLAPVVIEGEYGVGPAMPAVRELAAAQGAVVADEPAPDA